MVRHRQSTYNAARRFTGRADPSLSPDGAAAALDLAEAVRPLGFDLIIASPLRRARETADAVAMATGLPVELDARLVEHDVPAWEGLTRDEIDASWPGAWARWKEQTVIDVPGTEPWHAVEQRVTASLTEHAGRGQRVLVVAHAGVLRALGTGPLADTTKVNRSKGRWVRLVDGSLVDGGLERLG